MKIILFSRQGLAFGRKELCALRDAVQKFGFDYAVNEEFAAVLRQEADWVIPAQNCYGAQLGPQPAEAVMVCYGGDGTLLAGVHRMGEERIPVVGINAGHLGFRNLFVVISVLSVIACVLAFVIKDKTIGTEK